MAPAYEAAATELEAHMRQVKLNTDIEKAVSAGLDVRGMAGTDRQAGSRSPAFRRRLKAGV